MRMSAPIHRAAAGVGAEAVGEAFARPVLGFFRAAFTRA
jgi:hypothetical protein